MPKSKPHCLVFAYYPHASSNADGLEFNQPRYKGDLDQLKSRVESVVSKPSFLARVNYLSKDMSSTFAENHFGGWDYERYVHFNPKSTHVTVYAPPKRSVGAAFLICIKGPMHFKKLPQGQPVDATFWKKWPGLFNTHAHGNNVLGVFKGAQRNADGTWPKKGVAGEVECLGFRDRCPGEIPTSFRFVIGYYQDDPSEDPDDNRPTATKASLAKLLRQPKTWSNFYDVDSLPVIGDRGVSYSHRIGRINPSHITKIKILSAPRHNPTFWERLTSKYAGWIHHPNLVAVVDVENVPLVKVTEKPQRPMDDEFYDWMVAGHFHYAISGDGWINRERFIKPKSKNKRAPFHGQLYVMQMGEAILPDYRQFMRKSF